MFSYRASSFPRIEFIIMGDKEAKMETFARRIAGKITDGPITVGKTKELQSAIHSGCWSLRVFNKRKRKAVQVTKLDKRSKPDIDSKGQDHLYGPSTPSPSNSDASSGDDDELDSVEKYAKCPEAQLLTETQRKELATYVLHRFPKFGILSTHAVNDCALKILRVLELEDKPEYQL